MSDVSGLGAFTEVLDRLIEVSKAHEAEREGRHEAERAKSMAEAECQRLARQNAALQARVDATDRQMKALQAILPPDVQVPSVRDASTESDIPF